MKISVIIPTLNEGKTLPKLLPLLSDAEEIIVVDGGSTDATLEVARKFSVQLLDRTPGRALQMNAGADAATGDLLWFLHADTIPPSDWRKQIIQALSDPEIVGGGFRVLIEAPGLGFRLLDAWGWFRTRVQQTFYGDQGIFVRREVFNKLVGFFESALVEDLDFSQRMKRVGKGALLSGPLKTSARRWQTQGWWRTVFTHSRLSVTNQSIAVVVVAKDPIPGMVKTRLVPPLTEQEAANLAKQLLRETSALVQGLRGAHAMIAVAPRGGITHVRGLLPRSLHLIAQEEGDLGFRLSHVFQKLLHAGFQGVIALGADHPHLPPRYLRRGIALLRSSQDRVVLGPTEDGGYYLIGLNRFHPGLFEEIPWGGPKVFEETCRRAKAAGLPVFRLPSWYDIDRPEDLPRLRLSRLAPKPGGDFDIIML